MAARTGVVRSGEKAAGVREKWARWIMEKKENDTETERNEGQREGQAYPLTTQVTGRHVEVRRSNAQRRRVSLMQH